MTITTLKHIIDQIESHSSAQYVNKGDNSDEIMTLGSSLSHFVTIAVYKTTLPIHYMCLYT